MGLLYNLEVNELAVCLECDMMINDGETGCVAKFNEIHQEFIRKEYNEQASLLEKLYQTQHHDYFELTDEEVVRRLAFFFQKTSGRTEIVEMTDTQIEKFLETVFFYMRNIITTITIGAFEGVDKLTAEQMNEQWMHDICTSYFEYKEALFEVLNEGE